MSDSQTPSRNYRVPLAIVLGLTLLSGVVHGVLDGRWSQPDDLVAIGSQLDRLPQKMGDWVLQEEQGLDGRAQKLLRCYGSVVRVYRHEDSGAVVNVAVLFGPRGPIAVHTPEVCYSSVGTEQDGPTRREAITTADSRHEFWNLQFRQDGSSEPNLDVWYAWSDGEKWIAADHPRFWLTENLYKIQLAGPVGEGSQRPCQQFLK